MSIRNFLVSNSQPLWMSEIKDIYIAEPYVFHALEKENKLKQYASVEVAEFIRKTRSDLVEYSDFVNARYEKYTGIIASRLNKIHNTDHARGFWKKALSMAFIRYITLFYNQFRIFETYFDPERHGCHILSVESYFTPSSFDDHRLFFQYSDIGQEQIFSIYMNLFYPDKFNQISVEYEPDEKKIPKKGGIEKFKASKPYSFIRNIYRKLFRRSALNSSIVMGIYGSYFSAENMRALNEKSEGKISWVDMSIPENDSKAGLCLADRELIAEFEEDFDAFDRFFFAGLKSSMPRMFIENFKTIESGFIEKIEQYSNLKYIVCENWIGYAMSSMMLATSHEKGISHISNEHNCFFHPFAGSYIEHVISMSDSFTSLGWQDGTYPNMVRAASLFPFSGEGASSIRYKILFVAAPGTVKMTHFSSAYGHNEENFQKGVLFNISFFNELSNPSLESISYRKYPVSHAMQYDKEYCYGDLFFRLKQADVATPSRVQMEQSELVVIDYISTSYLECLIMNIPFIFFWNKEVYYLNDKYADFFDVLCDAGICQTDPAQAAALVENIKDDPKKWWESEKVQSGRKAFLKKNMGNPEDMIDYLVKLTNIND